MVKRKVIRKHSPTNVLQVQNKDNLFVLVCEQNILPEVYFKLRIELQRKSKSNLRQVNGQCNVPGFHIMIVFLVLVPLWLHRIRLLIIVLNF